MNIIGWYNPKTNTHHLTRAFKIRTFEKMVAYLEANPPGSDAQTAWRVIAFGFVVRKVLES